VQFRILGPLEVADGKGQLLALPTGKQRALLAVLLMHANEVVSADRLIDDIWGDGAPESAANALQVYVSQLRKLLDPGRSRGSDDEILVTRARGYALKVGAEDLDLFSFEHLAEEGRAALLAEQAEQAASRLEQALGLWRGPPLAEFAFERFAVNETLRLEELRLSAMEDLLEAQLALAQHVQLIGRLETLVAEQPLRERLRAQLMLALYRAGRQADALELFRTTRRLFVEELGIEPSPALQRLEQAILRQEPALELELPRTEELAAATPTRKPLTALVVDVEATDLDGSPLDPEAARPLLADWLQAAAAALERHGGQAEELPGGGLLGLFGLQAVREDDALRALVTADQLRRETRRVSERLAKERGIVLSMRAGAAVGEALVAAAEEGVRGRIAGSVISEATRLRHLAAPGEILVNERIRLLLGGAIVLEPAAGGFRLERVQRDAPAIPRRLDAPLVGREAELAALTQGFERVVAEKRVRLHTLFGAPGIGKSRLAKELIACLGDRADPCSGRCLPFGEASFSPLAEIVRQLIGETADVQAGIEQLLAGRAHAALIAERLAGALGSLERESASEEVFWAVRRLFELLARRKPLVVIFDDLQWAAPTLLDLVLDLAQTALRAPLLVLGLARPELLERRPDWPGETLELQPLGKEEAQALLNGLIGESMLEPELQARIAQTAEGNPLFLEQMVAMLREREASDQEVIVPPSIQALLAARLDLLLPEERRLLEHAAVAGREFALDDVLALTPAPEQEAVAELLEALERKQLLSPLGGGRQWFRHQLIRDAAYEAIPKLRRAGLHRAYADWLEDSAGERLVEVEELLAYNLERAFLLTRELEPGSESLPELGRRAALRLAGAGRRAHARGDMPAAVSLLRRAGELPPAGTQERAELVLAFASALREVGDFAGADVAVREVIELAADGGNPALGGQARLLRLRIELQTRPATSLDELLGVANATIDELEQLGDRQGVAEAWSVLAWITWTRCQAQATADLLERALEYAREADHQPTIGPCLHLLIGTWLFGPTPVKEAIARCEALLVLEETPRRIEATCYRALAGLRAMQGRFEEARVLLERDREIIDELGLRVASAVAAEIWGIVELLAGRPEAAEQRLRAGIAVLEPMGEASEMSTLAAVLAGAVYKQGRLAEVLELTELSSRSAADDDFSTQVQWRGAQAKALATEGQTEQAEALAAEAVELVGASDFLNLRGGALLDLAEVLWSGGRLREARAAAEQAKGLFSEKGNVIARRDAAAFLKSVTRRS
jgi:DNA-binding SARP family transcriptional activator